MTSVTHFLSSTARWYPPSRCRVGIAIDISRYLSFDLFWSSILVIYSGHVFWSSMLDIYFFIFFTTFNVCDVYRRLSTNAGSIQFTFPTKQLSKKMEVAGSSEASESWGNACGNSKFNRVVRGQFHVPDLNLCLADYYSARFTFK